jgi:hypothetical protein
VQDFDHGGIGYVARHKAKNRAPVDNSAGLRVEIGTRRLKYFIFPDLFFHDALNLVRYPRGFAANLPSIVPLPAAPQFFARGIESGKFFNEPAIIQRGVGSRNRRRKLVDGLLPFRGRRRASGPKIVLYRGKMRGGMQGYRVPTLGKQNGRNQQKRNKKKDKGSIIHSESGLTTNF